MRQGEVIYALDHFAALVGALMISRKTGNRVRVFKWHKMWIAVELPEHFGSWTS